MNNGKFYANLGTYVESTVNAFLKPNKDFKSILFRKRSITGESYIRLVDVFGDSYYYDVTAMNEGDICGMICDIVAKKPVKQQITDRTIKREVAPLFD